jgi:hypothetical protein
MTIGKPEVTINEMPSSGKEAVNEQRPAAMVSTVDIPSEKKTSVSPLMALRKVKLTV